MGSLVDGGFFTRGRWLGLDRAGASELLLWGGTQRFAALTAGLVSVSAGQMVFNILEARGRTGAAVHDRTTNCWATLVPPDRYSFPSGHTITAFAVAVPIGLFYPAALLFVLIFCAMSVASSRILLGLHYMSDVIAGIVIGCGLGIVAYGTIASDCQTLRA